MSKEDLTAMTNEQILFGLQLVCLQALKDIERNDKSEEAQEVEEYYNALRAECLRRMEGNETP